jgi:hypothetical protein
MSKTGYTRKSGVAHRYSITTRSVDRYSRDGSGRLPPPKYLPGLDFPLWDNAELDEHDRKAALNPQRVRPPQLVRTSTEPQPKRRRKHALENRTT